MPSFLVIGAVLAVAFAISCPLLLSLVGGGQLAVYISPPYGFDDIPNLTGKVAIVTGSNTGIGYVTARELARKGAKVIVAARNDVKGNDAVKRIKAEIGDDTVGGKLIEFMKLDLSSFAEVKKFAKAFSHKNLNVDILILNAAIVTPQFVLSVDGLETQIATNSISNFLLVKLLLPIIVRSKARVVSVSSGAHEQIPDGIRFQSFFGNGTGYDSAEAYAQTKLANILFSNELAERLNGTGATSNSLHPGLIATDLADIVWGEMLGDMGKKAIMSLVPMLSVDGGSLTQLYAATSPKMEGVTGKYLVPIAVFKNPSENARNIALQKKLWLESERLTKPFW
jgi:NAD(P)-dependent dehydrogenase (short-subunit alcohol dehydrogenase family)